MDGFLGEIRLFAGTFAPENWAFCDGAMLPIPGNQMLFAVIGSSFGGDWKTTFALPTMAPLTAAGPGGTPVRHIICTNGSYPNRR